jgi:hypothetical protein
MKAEIKCSGSTEIQMGRRGINPVCLWIIEIE